MMGNLYDNTEDWESGKLGSEEEYAKRSDRTKEKRDDALRLTPIELRFEKDFLADFKLICDFYNVSMGPKMRQIITEYVDIEMKNLARTYVKEIINDSN